MPVISEPTTTVNETIIIESTLENKSIDKINEEIKMNKLQEKGVKYLKSILDEKNDQFNKNYKITRNVSNKLAESIIGRLKL